MDTTFNWEFGAAEDFSQNYNKYYEVTNMDDDLKEPLLADNESGIGLFS